MMLPPDMRDWVGEDHPVHFFIASVDELRLPSLKVNRRGTGSPQYPPRMMLTLLLYCYAHGLFSSRKIEMATHENLAVRYLTGNTHPDHDTICDFRAQNGEAISEAFVEMGKLASRLGVLKLGTVSVDGTQLKANASKYKSVRYDRLKELEGKLEEDVAELLAEAGRQDRAEQQRERKLPAEISRRSELREKLRAAREELEEQAAEESERSKNEKEDRSGGSGPSPSSSRRTPEDSAQINLTDSDSRLMRKSRSEGYRQGYNAQATVDADGTQLILATSVIQTPSDAAALEPAIEQVERTLGEVQTAVADTGYRDAKVIERLQSRGVELYVATSTGDHTWRAYEFRPPRRVNDKEPRNPTLRAMREKVRSEEGRKIYGKRARSSETPFGTIKGALGFRQFLRRGLEPVREEWELVCLAYNVKRLWRLTGG